jgi:putative transposase
MLVTATESNAAYSGSEVALVDPRKTSQMCSRCGLIVKKEPLDRIHNYPECSLSMDRDLNAVMNVLRGRLQSLREIDGSPDL